MSLKQLEKQVKKISEEIATQENALEDLQWRQKKITLLQKEKQVIETAIRSLTECAVAQESLESSKVAKRKPIRYDTDKPDNENNGGTPNAL